MPKQPQEEWAKHVYREKNAEADMLANAAMDGELWNKWYDWNRVLDDCNHFKLTFDGGKHHKSGSAGAGWSLEIRNPRVGRVPYSEAQKYRTTAERGLLRVGQLHNKNKSLILQHIDNLSTKDLFVSVQLVQQ